MKNRDTQPESWNPCHPGLLHEAAQDVTVARRRYFRAASLMVVVVVLLSAVVIRLGAKETKKDIRQTPHAGIACVTVADHMSDYMSGRVENEIFQKQITYHIMNCELCREAYKVVCCSSCESRANGATLKPMTNKTPSP